MLDLKTHEQHINDLTQALKVEGVDAAKVSTILQALRDNYTEVETTVTDNTKKYNELTSLNEGLRSANMQLLSKLGTQIDDMFSRDKNMNNKGKEEDKQPEEKVLSLEEIANSF